MQPERVMTPESEKYAKIGKSKGFYQMLGIANNCSFVLLDMGVVEKVAKYGFPQSVIINSLRKNLANHCTTSYYLLLMD